MIYFQKSQPAPKSLAIEKLKVKGDYGLEDVIQRLSEDFKDKCYICEQKNFGTINVEHFTPKGKNLDLKFDWNNLFLACGHCNNTKLARFDDILDCTQTKDVETKIKYEFFNSGFPKEQVIITSLDEKSIKNLNTVNLLRLIYCGETPRKKLGSSHICNKISKEIAKLSDLLSDYFSDDDIFDKLEKEKLKRKIILKLSRCSSFTAFKHWIIRETPLFLREFEQYLN